MTQLEHGFERSVPGRARQGEPMSPHLQQLLRLFGPSANNGRVLEALERTIAGHPVGYFSSPGFGSDAREGLESAFSSVCLPESPVCLDEHVQYLQSQVFSRATPTASPSFIGHMTSALPSYLLPLAKIMTALNQNPVKLETSNAFTPLERQVLGMLHRLIYGNDEDFYRQTLHSGEHALGAFCAGGTTANITALWASRNNLLPADKGFAGVAREGLAKGLKHYGYDGLALLVSERGHYSLKKAADLLGIGQDQLIAVPTDGAERIRIDALQRCLERLRLDNIKPLALVGIAGTTETGAIDDLDAMADVAAQAGCHFHVDAAWGGASLMSDRQRPLFKGIERADSVVIDAHKQLYVPMGAGLVFFRQPTLTAAISQHANYIVRKGSKDLGRHTLEGSRSAMAMLLYANLHLLGRQGYEQLIDHGVDNARYFADLIKQQDDFELLSEPQLCLLTYRYVPSLVMQALHKADAAKVGALQECLDALNDDIQERQRDAGRSFVSRTRLTPERWANRSISVLRVVLANPLTTASILQEVVQEQRALALGSRFLPRLLALLDQGPASPVTA
ncbi:pyridoxal-dependent aspartate 1-decarboxylase PanP [Pseudomonas chlororaphis]|uniref:pyridoxal-dependent aspartate 1-decarboxylase PanP n=1 Tax=Pseudomonas chlororaphis TaxID=587753 RepID=UPI001CA3BBE1|nr:putative pyridoxal-dependent aspartate 1-decarboxylase [Pseudomonas chlororaphis]